jgi:hypothetical protein
MASYTTMRILHWQTTFDHYLNILPFRFVKLQGSRFFAEYGYGDSESRKWMWNMGISFLVQVLLSSFLILQTYFNYVDIPNLILSVSLSVICLFGFFSQLLWMVRMKSLILLSNNFLELNSYLGKSFVWSGLFHNC